MSLIKKSKVLKTMICAGASVLTAASLSIGLNVNNDNVSRASSLAQNSSTGASTRGADSAQKQTATSGMSSTDSTNDFLPNTNTNIDHSKMVIYPFDMNQQGGNYQTETYSIPSIIQNTANDDTTTPGAGYATL
ncbi:hypothetical protein [Malacoplasma penetrans HF-2]|uniref:Uncharacterized protein n=1 Tax=Malacoplasma penetrans (strain HF-2) TaxID=272633 RepID=Q8EUY6_MALP2|nr:hypothetical protein [Malacoplasma penetrans]BAC44575.1 hypothetical protein [Malacoplasma penetrans HF-2]